MPISDSFFKTLLNIMTNFKRKSS